MTGAVAAEDLEEDVGVEEEEDSVEIGDVEEEVSVEEEEEGVTEGAETG